MTSEFYEKNNERFLRLLSYYLNVEDTLVERKSVEEVAACGVSREYAFALVLAESLGVDADGKDKEFFNEYFVPSIKELSVEDYYANDYFSLVKFNGEVFGDAELTYLTYAPYRGFVRDDFEYFMSGKVLPLIGFFPTEYRYPAIKKNGREWMTLLPNEINSQIRYVDEAFGKVLTYGLGLGYYALEVALKKEVESVTVVDIDEEVISLFSSEILPLFPREIAAKIRIIKADAFEFAENLKDGSFDYIYADIWHDAADGVELYEKFKTLERFCPSARYGYWIEKTLKHYL